MCVTSDFGVIPWLISLYDDNTHNLMHNSHVKYSGERVC